ncbi:excitatory amino acid transporter 3-like [Ostrea edulis]|uniref:excitatory amino acid transporter 3-like n=1 Tax=Ostrea edulis TaxID=37623 RepID=UPI0024AFC123|nr:excitatory amino acid transporter 3-like [Ostrea edulis]
MGNRQRSEKCKKIIKDNLLVLLMILAVIIGVSMGLGLRSQVSADDKKTIFYLKFPGDLLLNMLKMLILPLIVSSLISAMSGLKAQASGRMGFRTLIYYFVTTFCAVIIGIVLVVAIEPGKKRESAIERSGSSKAAEGLSSLLDLIRNCFPDNLISACFQKVETKPQYEKITIYPQTTPAPNMTGNSTITIETTDTTMSMTTAAPKVIEGKLLSIGIEIQSGMNVLGLVVFSLFFGGILARLGEKGKPLIDVFDCLHLVTMKLINLVIWYSPIGVTFLIASKLVAMERPAEMFTQLGFYMLTVLVGLAIHAFIILPLVYFIFTRKNPYSFMYGMLQALLTAWGTASSSATLPITMNCLEERNHVDPRVTMFVTPIGATVNMDGTALYEAVAAIFIAQYLDEPLNFGQIVIISLTATAAAIGAAGVPSAGLVTMAIVLSAVGLPVEEVRLILAIDWFLDRFRTAVNVLGDSYGAGIVNHLSRQDLEEMDLEENKQKYLTEDKTNGLVNDSYDTKGDHSTKM